MAYFFAVLAAAAADQCIKLGLPVPAGLELPSAESDGESDIVQPRRKVS